MTPDGERRARACISIAQEMILSALMAIDQGDPESADAFVSDAISDLGKARMHITRPSDPTKTPPKTTV